MNVQVDDDQIVLKLIRSETNPRNSEGAFIDLNDGRILFAYGRWNGQTAADDASAELVTRTSNDGGRTWSDYRVIVTNDAGCNVMSISLLRLEDGDIALFYLRKHNSHDCRLMMRTSNDEGLTWSEPTSCMPGPGYFGVCHDRVVRLQSGRIIVPAVFGRTKVISDVVSKETVESIRIALFFISDDDGKTWRESQDWLALPVRSTTGLQEPGAVQLSDGKIYAWFRTSTGYQYQSISDDDGETWTTPEQSPFRSPAAPMTIKRIPSTGDLLAIWNDRTGIALDAPEARYRNTLATSISSDDGKTWSETKLLEDEPTHGYAYVAIHFVDDAVLLAYNCGDYAWGLQDLCLRRLPLDALYD